MNCQKSYASDGGGAGLNDVGTTRFLTGLSHLYSTINQSMPRLPGIDKNDFDRLFGSSKMMTKLHEAFTQSVFFKVNTLTIFSYASSTLHWPTSAAPQ